jgi:hypothetical protein
MTVDAYAFVGIHNAGEVRRTSSRASRREPAADESVACVALLYFK